MTTLTHHALRLDLFGGHVAVLVDDEDADAARAGLHDAEARLREWHARLTRFEPDSELSRLNRDARTSVPASPMLLDLADAVPWAGALSGGLVDATQLRALERAGYARTFSRVRGGGPAPTPPSGAGLPPRRPAGPDPHRRWGRVVADRARGAVRRPPGVRLDSGGLGKGLAADDVAGRLGHLARVAVDCCGDLRLGGRATSRPRRVAVADPVGAGAVAGLDLQGGWGVATSGVTRRAWATDGRRAHHLLDPATGGPAWTGIVQVTAKAPTALEAEVRAKAALLAGPASAADHLVHGGVVILEDGTLWVVAG